MSEDKRTLTMSYGDRHYRLEISTQIEVQRGWRQQFEQLIISKVYLALAGFHAQDNSINSEHAKTRAALHELAFDMPEMVHELSRRGLLR